MLAWEAGNILVIGHDERGFHLRCGRACRNQERAQKGRQVEIRASGFGVKEWVDGVDYDNPSCCRLATYARACRLDYRVNLRRGMLPDVDT